MTPTDIKLAAQSAGLWVTDKRWRWALAIFVAGLAAGFVLRWLL